MRPCCEIQKCFSVVVKEAMELVDGLQYLYFVVKVFHLNFIFTVDDIPHDFIQLELLKSWSRGLHMN